MNRPSALLDSSRPAVAVLVRVILGYLMIRHGLDKFDTGLGNVGDQFAIWGVPAPDLSAAVTAFIEVVGGVGLVLGLGTRFFALAMTGVLLGALYFVKAELGVLGGSETDLAYIAGLLSVVVIGPGALAIDRVVGIETPSSTNTSVPEPRSVDV